MARKVIEHMERIFEKLIQAVSEEENNRIANTKRHIKASGNETIVVDFVKNAIIKKIPISDFVGCLFIYKETKYFLVSTMFSHALLEIGLDEYIVSENSCGDEKEITQGCEMLSISEGILDINPQYSSLDLIEECLGMEGEEGNVTFDFSHLRKFFIDSTIFIIEDSRFSLQYEEDFFRLCCYCICDDNKLINPSIIKKLLLLESSRSVAATIINGLRSSLKEYSFLQYYHCLEYLFRLNNSFELQDKFSIGVPESIGIVTEYDFKLTENENLRRVITNYISDTEINTYHTTTGGIFSESDSKEKKCESAAQEIYKIRCQIAHLRYGQDTFLESLDWDKRIMGILELVLAIYQKCGARVEQVCKANGAWHTINFSKNDKTI